MKLQANKMDNTTTDIEQDDLYEHFKFIASEGQEPLRVDKFLMNFIENATRNKIQQSVKAGNVLVNDTVVKSNYKVKAKDTVRVVLAHPPHENLLVAEDIPIDIVYEDDVVIVVNKPAGMVVHPGHGNYSGTLVNGLIYHIENLPKNSMSRIKKLTRSAYGNKFTEQIKLETDFMVQSQGDNESIEGIDSFLEKRSPDYKKLR